MVSLGQVEEGQVEPVLTYDQVECMDGAQRKVLVLHWKEGAAYSGLRTAGTLGNLSPPAKQRWGVREPAGGKYRQEPPQTGGPRLLLPSSTQAPTSHPAEENEAHLAAMVTASMERRRLPSPGARHRLSQPPARGPARGRFLGDRGWDGRGRGPNPWVETEDGGFLSSCLGLARPLARPLPMAEAGAEAPEERPPSGAPPSPETRPKAFPRSQGPGEVRPKQGWMLEAQSPRRKINQWAEAEARACRQAVGGGAGLPSSCSALSPCRRRRSGRSCPPRPRGTLRQVRPPLCSMSPGSSPLAEVPSRSWPCPEQSVPGTPAAVVAGLGWGLRCRGRAWDSSAPELE
ncbi:hypothetical protein P7K49_009414 [Saguinus oedipus]|uniref:Uncharacterized protein n=1 Tax=Saguinus oedipus TaxID=9490 RepID=A0ABQ9VJX5_SAGOE|nr:hypothetical protein P7K49_009414 [Saguinus oedipus]